MRNEEGLFSVYATWCGVLRIAKGRKQLRNPTIVGTSKVFMEESSWLHLHLIVSK